MSAAPVTAPRRASKQMSEPGDPPSSAGAAARVEDIERALVLAREVAAATAGGSRAKLRMEHLQALFGNGNGAIDPDRIQAALEATGLQVDPPLRERPETVSLQIDPKRTALAPKNGGRKAGAEAGQTSGAPAAAAGDDQPSRPAGVAAYQAAAGALRRRKPAPQVPAEGVTLDDAQRIAAEESASHNTPKAVAALLPATIVPVLAASFLGPLFGVVFAGLTLVASATLSRPGALATGKLGPIRMPASLARSFLLVSFGVALGALAASGALIAAGKSDTTPTNENAPIQDTQPPERTTPPAPPAQTPQQKQQDQLQKQKQKDADAAADKRADQRRAARRRAARERRRQDDEQDSTPPSGGGSDAPATTTP